MAMHSWFYSLQFRLMLGFTLVLALALGSVGLYVAYAAQREVEEFDRKAEEARNARLEQMVSRSYSSPPKRGDFQSALEQAGALYDRRIIVTDEQGDIIGDSGRPHGKPWRPGPHGGRHIPLRVGGEEVGSITVAPNDAPETVPDPPVSEVTAALKRSLMLTGLATGAVGILLISVVSRRILVPVRVLSLAAQRLGQGDLSQRVSASGPGEIKQLAYIFNTMAENLQRAEQQRRDLVADVAHELRTPVSNIQIYLEAIEDGLLGTDEALAKIQRQSSQLATLIEDLRLLSMAEVGRLRLDLELCPLEEVLSQSVEAVRPRAEAKGISLSLEAAMKPSIVRIDKLRVSQVMANLLDNAIFYTPEGGSVTVSSEADGSSVRVTVADTGEGIPADVLPRIFERFYRVDQSRTRATGGTGLGLTIARQLVELHQGTIRAESAPGQGSRFIFELPLSNARPHTDSL